MKDTARLLRTLVDNIPAMVGYWDRDLLNVLANDAYVEWFGMSPEQMLGLHIREVIGEDLFAKNLPFIKAALAGEPQLFDREIVDASGVLRFSQAYYIPDIDESEQVNGFFVLVVDVSPRVRAERELAAAHAEMARRATTDALTGLFNRALLEERLEQAVTARARNGSAIALLMIDLDHFKPVNDQHGHAAGDVLLVEVAARLRSAVRQTDVVARVGGDEFVVLCPEITGPDEVGDLADRLVDVLGQHLVLPDVAEPMSVGGSVGVVVTGPSTRGGRLTAAALMREADRRMYDAKHAGRGRWQGGPPLRG
ncbi:diguanylate cyclase [Aeromicrobium stalagmiti]|uniref:diguanylate cyclase n=1 Tax=Aeromicrobium stalagmiti TaxID=2738988 RepID=UPI00156A15B3|nr:GGDEF domain-containing protein [Aeromicrobium stalagmiti]